MSSTQKWYIVKEETGRCEIVASDSVANESAPETQQRWGPFSSREEAIARRIGLIRAGKCQPL